MFLEAFKITGSAVSQIFLLAAIGYFLVKREFLGPAGLDALSRLVMEVTLPLLIFCQLVRDFRFSLYPDWWVFPLISLVITALALAVGGVFSWLIKGRQQRLQFLSLVGFQNSGYLPLALAGALLPKDKMDTLFIYIFLFLLGFNLLIFSLGAYMLTFSGEKKFDWRSLSSPPVVTIIFSLLFIYFGFHKFVPAGLLKPLRAAGDCTLPLAMFVVGGALAQLKLGQINIKAMALVTLLKMIILPLFGLWLVLKFRFPELVGLLILIELAVPSATTLSLLLRHYKKEDFLISQGILLSHLISLASIPVFLSLYFTLVVIQ